MEPKLIAVHGLLALLLFIVSNWIGKHSIRVGYMQLSLLAKSDEAPAFNFLYRAFTPIAFIAIASALLAKCGASWAAKDLYMVVVYYFALRLAFNLCLGRGRLLNWWYQAALVAVAIPAAYAVCTNLIEKSKVFLPSATELGSAIWIAIALYLYHTVNSVKASSKGTEARKARYLGDRYSTYSRQFASIIEAAVHTKRQEMLVYAVLIYEAFNRPKFYRILERVLFRFKLAKTLGIMQVRTSVLIDDAESVRLGAAKLVADHQVVWAELEARERPFSSWDLERGVLAKYNPDPGYVSEVVQVLDQLVERYAPEAKIDWSQELASLHTQELDLAKKLKRRRCEACGQPMVDGETMEC